MPSSRALAFVLLLLSTLVPVHLFSSMPTVSISDSFDGGNIQYIKEEPDEQDTDVLDVTVRIKPDPYTELEERSHMQYFAFRSTMMSDQRVRYVVENAYDVSYPEAWPGSTVFWTTNVVDADSWKRVPDTFYTEGKLHWQHTGPAYFSYFPPYSYNRHLQFVSECAKYATVESLGQSLEGREIECITTGTGPLKCWIIHRQHPGESMAEYYAEGLLTKLLGMNGNDDAQRVKELYTFYIVPCMCPDGSVRGHLRTNACGANLNREWATVQPHYTAPSLERSPEVYHVLNKMDETGVDCFLDIHGDEELPYNFLSGGENVPRWSQRLEKLHGAFLAAYCRADSDMQAKFGYPPMEDPEQVLKYMNVATNQVVNRFECFGATLEMPFKDCLSNPDPERGWSPERSRQLGAFVLKPLEFMAPYFRSDQWSELEDSYVKMTDDYQGETKSEFVMLKKRFFSDVHEIHKSKPAKAE